METRHSSTLKWRNERILGGGGSICHRKHARSALHDKAERLVRIMQSKIPSPKASNLTCSGRTACKPGTRRHPPPRPGGSMHRRSSTSGSRTAEGVHPKLGGVKATCADHGEGKHSQVVSIKLKSSHLEQTTSQESEPTPPFPDRASCHSHLYVSNVVPAGHVALVADDRQQRVQRVEATALYLTQVIKESSGAWRDSAWRDSGFGFHTEQHLNN